MKSANRVWETLKFQRYVNNHLPYFFKLWHAKMWSCVCWNTTTEMTFVTRIVLCDVTALDDSLTHGYNWGHWPDPEPLRVKKNRSYKLIKVSSVKRHWKIFWKMECVCPIVIDTGKRLDDINKWWAKHECSKMKSL